MNSYLCVLLSAIVFIQANFSAALAQGVGINPSGAAPNSSAALDIDFTTKGLLIPRLTTAQRNALGSPVDGLQIFNTTTKCFEFYAYGAWQTGACPACPPSAPTAGTHIPAQTQVEWNWNTASGASGYKWSTSNNYASATDNGSSTSYTQTGLTCGTSYTLYVWSYSGCGNSASPQTLTTSTAACPFVCGSSTISDIDGNVYTTVLIGGKCWMKSNLNTTKDAAGNAITRYCYNNNASNCTTYGGLYTWATAMNGSASSNTDPSGVQGICPTSWHLPSRTEWTNLQLLYGIVDNAGGPLKSTGTSLWASPNASATNSSGFTGFPGGNRQPAGTWGELTFRGDWWNSTEVATNTANGNSRNLYYSHGGFYESELPKTYGVSVRCMKN